MRLNIKIYYLIGFIITIIGCNKYVAGPLSYPKYADGYDISHHNTNIKWDKLKAQFVYLKATEGTTFKDPKFIEYTRQAKAHGIKVGAYHFMSPTTSGKRQFEYFSKKVGNSMDLIPVLDVEVMGITDDDIKQFIDACEKHYGVKPMIYANLFFYGKHYSVIKDCKWWMCSYLPWGFKNYTIWQYSKSKRVNGTVLDHNKINPKYTINELLL